ncbi:MAG TPA: hypothetical protein VKS01_09315, partial [Bryobacteraceae bacterium]|nr:hypothetical protein [Bryobacteraceae bacterium]
REALGEDVVKSLDLRPMKKPAQGAAPEVMERRPPRREERGLSERIGDPVLDLVYRQSLPK